MTPQNIAIRRALLVIICLASFAFFVASDPAWQAMPVSEPAPTPEGEPS